ncbi:MAG: hypothetical protein ACREGB_02825 [Candidatus Saccharimonadales bacterium]
MANSRLGIEFTTTGNDNVRRSLDELTKSLGVFAKAALDSSTMASSKFTELASILGSLSKTDTGLSGLVKQTEQLAPAFQKLTTSLNLQAFNQLRAVTKELKEGQEAYNKTLAETEKLQASHRAGIQSLKFERITATPERKAEIDTEVAGTKAAMSMSQHYANQLQSERWQAAIPRAAAGGTGGGNQPPGNVPPGPPPPPPGAPGPGMGPFFQALVRMFGAGPISPLLQAAGLPLGYAAAGYATYQVASAYGGRGVETEAITVRNSQTRAAEEALAGDPARQIMRDVGLGRAQDLGRGRASIMDYITTVPYYGFRALTGLAQGRQISETGAQLFNEAEELDQQRYKYLHRATSQAIRQGDMFFDQERMFGQRQFTNTLQFARQAGISDDTSRNGIGFATRFGALANAMRSPTQITSYLASQRDLGFSDAALASIARNSPNDLAAGTQHMADTMARAGLTSAVDIPSRQAFGDVVAQNAGRYESGNYTGADIAFTVQQARMIPGVTGTEGVRYGAERLQTLEGRSKTPGTLEYRAQLGSLMRMGYDANTAQLLISRGLTRPEGRQEAARISTAMVKSGRMKTALSPEQIGESLSKAQQGVESFFEKGFNVPQETKDVLGNDISEAFRYGTAEDLNRTKGAKLSELFRTTREAAGTLEPARPSTRAAADVANAKVQAETNTILSNINTNIVDKLKEASDQITTAIKEEKSAAYESLHPAPQQIRVGKGGPATMTYQPATPMVNRPPGKKE